MKIGTTFSYDQRTPSPSTKPPMRNAGIDTVLRVRLKLFFFQAEDGIRDPLVTGVLTCALPILSDSRASTSRINGAVARSIPSARSRSRSEERRVGKECSSRGSPYSQTEKH